MKLRVRCILAVPLLLLACQTRNEPPGPDLGEKPEKLEIFGKGTVSTPLYERDLAIAPDGTEIIFTLGNYKQTRRCLVSMKKEAGGWGARKILPFSGKYNDIEPFFAPDGRQLFFASDRPMSADSLRKDYNIWKVDISGTGWEEPVPLDTVINTPGDEFYPAVAKNGNLYFTATRPEGIGREDIYVSNYRNQAYMKPLPLDSTINTAVFEFNAYIDPEEKLLIFSSFGRADGQGGGDLYFSRKDREGKWSEARNMGTLVNSDKLDYCPFLDKTNNNFYFTSDRAETDTTTIHSVEELEGIANEILNGMGNIYRIGAENLKLEN